MPRHPFRTPTADPRPPADPIHDGAGLPAGFDPAASTRLGLQIVRTLVEGELRGTLLLRGGLTGGTEVLLEVPLPGEPTEE